MNTILPVLRYPGSKWSMAEEIIRHFPQHKTYVEPFFGGGSILFSKLPSEYEVVNDKSLVVVNFWRTVRDSPTELARLVDNTPWSREEYELSYQFSGDSLEDSRRFLVRCWMAYGVRLSSHTGWKNRGSSSGSSVTDVWDDIPNRILIAARRIKKVEVDNREAWEVVDRYSDQDDALIYNDPPYVLETRSGNSYYYHEMTDEEHFIYLKSLLKVQGSVVVSGYEHGLYDYVLKGWHKEYIDAIAEQHQPKKEVLWMNRKAAYNQQLSFDIE